MKKIFALVLAMLLVLGMTSAFAANITINDDSATKHVYKVYQIFTGDLEGGILSNVKYGSNYGTEGTAVPKTTLDHIMDVGADAYAREIFSQLSGNPITLNKDDLVAEGLANGYYLIVDDTAQTLNTGDAFSAYMVEVVKNVTVTPKKDTTSVDKKITGDTLGTATASNPRNPDTENKDNVSIGDTVFYSMEATIPPHAVDYDYFFFIFEDKMDEGLTFNKEATDVKVYSQSGDDVNTKTELTNGVDYDYDNVATANYTFRVGMRDAKSLAGKKIIVEYSAVLNEKAKIGEESNDNTSKIKYSNNPNTTYDGDKDSTTPGFPKSDSQKVLGETPTDTTETRTTQIKLRKVDETGKPLTGAEFTLTGDSVQTVIVKKSAFVKDGEEGFTGPATYYKLKDGTYTTEDPTDDEYVADGTGDANTTTGYIKVGDEYIVPEDKTQYNGQPLYKFVKGTRNQYDSGKEYQKINATDEKIVTSSSVTARGEVDGEGYVTFVGLGAGEYTISETKTPKGYNTIADQKLEIVFTADPVSPAKHWSVGSETTKDASNNYVFSYNDATGTFEAQIVNMKGHELPSTGGIGTTLFYVAGSILVLAAVIFLVTKRRMNANND